MYFIYQYILGQIENMWSCRNMMTLMGMGATNNRPLPTEKEEVVFICTHMLPSERFFSSQNYAKYKEKLNTPMF